MDGKQSNSGRPRILIVEDENIVALDLKNRLIRLGYGIAGVVRSGEEAVRLACDQKPDLILMDIMLGGRIDGIEAAQKIYLNMDIPVVYLTAYADNETLERAKLTAPYGYILKPFDERELHTTVKMALYKHQIQRRLKESEKKLKTILNSIDEAVIGIDRQERVTFLNPVAEVLTGYRQEEALGKPVHEIYQVEPLESHQKEYITRPGRFDGYQDSQKLILKSRKNRKYLIEEKVSPLQSIDDTGVGYVIVFRDITDHEKLENAFRQIALSITSYTGEDFYKTLVLELIKVLNLDYAFIGRLRYDKEHKENVNPKVETLAACQRDGLIENFVYDLQGTPCDEVYKQSFKIFPHSVQELFPGDGMLKEMGIHGYIGIPLFDGNKRAIGIMVGLSLKPIEDVSLAETIFRIFASRAEAELERQLADEEKRALEVQLQHTQKLRSLGILAGGIAHDFNNLLVGILGNAGLLLNELPENSPARDIVLQIERASQQAADLTRQLLAYSGKGKFVSEPIHLHDLIRDMSSLLKVSVKKNVHLKYEFSRKLPYIKGDPAQIRQVLMNLLTNASEAIGDEEGIITVETGVVDADQAYFADAYFKEQIQPGRYVYLSVADTGCGMDEETLSKIFDPFFTTKFTGRGLGLATLVGIVRGHRGAIKVNSSVGEGTTFTIYFPVFDYVPKKKQKGSKPKKARQKPHRSKILLVDDEEVVRKVTTRILERYGYEVLCAESGRRAIEIYRRMAPEIELVILDMTMPEMNGIETFREMKKIRENIRVLLTSGYSEDEAAKRLIVDGLVGFVQKPFKPDDLHQRVMEALAKNSRNEQGNTL